MTDFRLPIAAGRRARGWPPFVNRKSKIANAAAFSLVEILIVVSLMSVIILGLVAMFGQTQRAFRLGMTQVDVLGAGRIVNDLLGRELAQITPARTPHAVNFIVYNYDSLEQPLPGASGPKRQYVRGELFFLTKENQTWNGIGFHVRRPDVTEPDVGFGTLYRFAVTSQFGEDPNQLYHHYTNLLSGPHTTTPPLKMSRLVDGVVHFSVRAYDAHGLWLTNISANNMFAEQYPMNSLVAPGEVQRYIFVSNAVPAAVELELGILENQVLERARSIPNPTARRNFVEQQSSRVHLFRQRVAVRNVDPQVYP